MDRLLLLNSREGGDPAISVTVTVVTLLPDSASAVVESGRFAHLVTLSADGSHGIELHLDRYGWRGVGDKALMVLRWCPRCRAIAVIVQSLECSAWTSRSCSCDSIRGLAISVSRSGQIQITAQQRNNPSVTLRPSDVRGHVKAGTTPLTGTVELVTSGPDFETITSRMKVKYGLMVPIMRLVDSVRHLNKGPFPYADTGVVITLLG